MSIDGLIQWHRRWKLRRCGVTLSPDCIVGLGVSLGSRPAVHPAGAVMIGTACELGAGVELNPWGGSIRIGRRVFIGPQVVIYGQGGVEIGDCTLIAMQCSILSSNHTVPGRSALIRDQPDRKARTKIGRDVWLGAGVRVLAGVTIGDGAVVGAGAVVTRDLPPYTIAMGVPARVVRHRE